MIADTYALLSDYDSNRELKPKSYLKSFEALMKAVEKNLGYTAKGRIQERYTGVGIAIGVALGAGFVGVNPAFIGIGLPIGLAIGMYIGKKKEQEVEEAGKTY